MPESLLVEGRGPAVGGAGSFFSRSRKISKPAHSDPKMPFEGMDGISLQTALNQGSQLRSLLSQPSPPVNRVDPDGDRTPIHWAAARGYTACLQALLKAGADPGSPDKHGRNASEIARAYGQTDAALMIEAWLVGRGGSTDETGARM